MPLPRRTLPLLCAALLPLLAPPAGAQTASGSSDIAPAQRGGDVMPPVEILAQTSGSSVRCEPGEARFPAGDEIDLRLINRGDQRVVFEAPQVLVGQNVVRSQGDVVPTAGGKGYLVKQGGVGRLIVRTPPPGSYPYTCAGDNSTGDPFRGTLTIVPKAQ